MEYFPRLVEETINMKIDVWLYGVLSAYGSEKAQKGFASVELDLPVGATVSDLLKTLNMPI